MYIIFYMCGNVQVPLDKYVTVHEVVPTPTCQWCGLDRVLPSSGEQTALLDAVVTAGPHGECSKLSCDQTQRNNAT